MIGRDKELALSFAQQRLWFLSRLEGVSSTYNEPMSLRLSGSLDVLSLSKAVDEIVRRHEILRTTYEEGTEEPFQVIHPFESVPLPIDELSTDDDSQLQVRFAEEVNRPFDLAKDPPIRVKLFRVSDELHYLVVAIHHIACDGWSMGVFFRELASHYEDYSQGNSSRLSPLPIQYADFAHWQRMHLQGSRLEQQLSYWRNRLAGAPALLELPTDFLRPPVQSFRGSTVRFKLSAELSEKIRGLARRYESTLFVTLLTGFAVLLRRYSEAEDFVMGTPIANRTSEAIEPLIGFFVNTLALRIDCKGDPSFEELLRRNHQIALEAYDHQDLPFEKLVEELNPERSLSYHPLFQVMFALQNASTRSSDFAGLKVSQIPIQTETAKFDLILSMNETDSGLSGELQYNSDIFHESTIERMAENFETLLWGIVAQPEQSIESLPILSAKERHQLLVEWNQSETEYPRDKCIHELFEEQVERTPAAVAVIFGGQQLTYLELNQKANQLAHYLISQGVEPGDSVGLCLERSAEAIVVVLAILKIGAVYVPLDFEYPSERLQYLISDADVSIILARPETCSELLEGCDSVGAKVVCLEGDMSVIESCESLIGPQVSVVPQQAAYINYTSGSTGRPKGVVVPHLGVVRLVRNTNYIIISEGDRIAQAATLSFDAATFEIWGALLNGGVVVGLDRETILAPRIFSDALRNYRIDILFLTTALVNQCSRENPDIFSPLKCLLFGGEAVEPEYIRRIMENGAPQRLVHVYGPTENSTFSVWHQIDSVAKDAATIPIGRPIANTQCYVLDRQCRPVPIGVPGELCLAGDGLALGYHSQADLTAKAFPDLTLDNANRMRLYKTGDRVRYLPDGALEFIGRQDRQVKIRGFRIELGEIESVLSDLSAVEACFVCVSEDCPGEKRIIAYMVMAQDYSFAEKDLREKLATRLPNYMIPSYFVPLAKMPLNKNGKVDINALPKPEPKKDIGDNETLAPRTALEKQLVRIWEDCLNVKPIGIRDNFFDLGGHSILAMRLLYEMERKTGLSCPMNYLFQWPTIEAITAASGKPLNTELPRSIVLLKKGAAERPMFLLHAGGPSLLFYRPLVQRLQSDRSIYGIQSAFLEKLETPIESVQALAQYYIDQVRRVQPQGPYSIGGASFGGVVAYEMARQLTSMGEAIESLILFDSFVPPVKYRLISKQWYRLHLMGIRQTGVGYLANKIKKRFSHEAVKVKKRWQRGKAQNDEKFTIHTTERHSDKTLNVHRMLNHQYCPGEYSGKVIVIHALEVKRDRINPDEDHGWSHYARDVEVIRCPGGHMSMFREPHVSTLASRIDEILEGKKALVSSLSNPDDRTKKQT